MKRDVLISAVRRIAGELGYLFHTGPEDRIPARVRDMPVLWLTPVKLTSVRGRRECRNNYQMNIYLMMSATQQMLRDAEPALAVLESDAVRLHHLLSEDPAIARSTVLKTSVAKLPLTKNSEIALSVEMDAELFYCRQ